MFALVSCRGENVNDEKHYASPEKMLQKTFFDNYGAPASGQTWNTAAKHMLNVTLPAATGKLTVSIYSANPLVQSNNAIKLAEYTELQASQVHNLAFEGPGYLSNVYVAVQSGSNISVSSAVSIDASGNCKYTLEEAPSESGRIYSRDMEYIIAYEDLGVAVDLDYNDVVLGVTYVAGQKQAKVHLWALGTLIYAYAYYKDNKLFEERELHDRFGISNNTTANVFTPGDVFSLEARNNSKFDLSIFPELQVKLDVPEDYSFIDDVASFAIKTQPSAKPLDEEIKTITVPKKAGEIPFAIVVADPDWCWPTETTSIGKAYPNFAKWVSEPNSYNWYK